MMSYSRECEIKNDMSSMHLIGQLGDMKLNWSTPKIRSYYVMLTTCLNHFEPSKLQ